MKRTVLLLGIVLACGLFALPARAAGGGPEMICLPFLGCFPLPPPPPHHPPHLPPPHHVATPAGPQAHGGSASVGVMAVAAWGAGTVLTQFATAAAHPERQLTYAEGHGAMVPLFGEKLFGDWYRYRCSLGGENVIYCGH